MQDLAETRTLLEYIRHYKNAEHFTWCYHPDDLNIPASPVGKLQMLQDSGYLKFKSSPLESDLKENKGMFQIYSLALTPEGETLLCTYRERRFLGRSIKLFGTVFASVVTAILTVLVMKLLGLVE